MRHNEVYVKFVEDFETDKEILRNFVKKYSRDIKGDLDYIDNRLDAEELYNDDYVVCVHTLMKMAGTLCSVMKALMKTTTKI